MQVVCEFDWEFDELEVCAFGFSVTMKLEITSSFVSTKERIQIRCIDFCACISGICG